MRINPGLVTATARKPIPVARTANTGSGFADPVKHWREISHYQLTLTGIHMHIGSGGIMSTATVCDAMAELVITNNLDIRAGFRRRRIIDPLP